MDVVTNIQNFLIKNVNFSEPMKNNIIYNSTFLKIIYSIHEIDFKGIYIHIELNNLSYCISYNKYKCLFNYESNKETIEKLVEIEKQILQKYNSSKTHEYKLSELLNSGHIKINNCFNNCLINQNNNSFVLKISGIWEKNNTIGITYKFNKVNPSVE